MTFNRRDVLKACLSAMPAAALSSRSVSAASLRALQSALATGAPANPLARMLTIFLRGGNDSMNTIAPIADPDYPTFRTNISLSLGASDPNRLCKRVPRYPAVGIHDKLDFLHGLMSQAGGGPVAVLHRIGNFEAERSHFTEQHLVETGLQQYLASAEGWVPQLLPSLGSTAPMKAVSESNRLMRMYLSSAANKAAVHLQGVYDSNPVRNIDVPFAIPGTPEALVARAARGVSDPNTTAYPLVGSGSYLRSNLRDSVDILTGLRNAPPITHDDVKYPALNQGNATWLLSKFKQFFLRLEESITFLNRGDSNIVGLELGGFDTHKGQLVAQAELFAVLDRAIKSAYDDLSAGSDPFLILVVTEFGRTARDNGDPDPMVLTANAGTDHGVGGLCFAIGSTVNGGLYNMSHPSWPQDAAAPTGNADWDFLATTPSTGTFANALVPITDFRVPFVEIALNFFGFNATEIGNFDSVGAEWGQILANQGLVRNQLLGFV